MVPTSTHDHTHPARAMRRRRFGGVALIGVGAWLLAARLTDSRVLGLLFLPLLGLGLIAWALEVHRGGMLIPGGILLGVGSGAALTAGPLQNAPANVQSGIFLLAFAAGWLLITALSGLVDTYVYRWPLIPGGMLAAIGAILLIGAAAAPILAFFAAWWPIGVIAAGLILLFHRSPRS